MASLCIISNNLARNLLVALLSGNLPSVRKKILVQYVRFSQNLLKRKSPEIVMLANTVGIDLGPVTGKNLFNVGCEFDLDPWKCSPDILKKMYSYYSVPDVDKWRLPFLGKPFEQKMDMEACEENSQSIRELIDSLCSS